MNATAQQVQLQRVNLLVVNPPGTMAQYKEQYTKLHAWSLPCRQVACAPSDCIWIAIASGWCPLPNRLVRHLADFDYDGFALRNIDSIFDECGASSFCAVPDTMTPINPKARGTYFNGGALVLRPNRTTYERLLRGAEADVHP